MAADGTIIIDTRVDTTGIKQGETNIKKSLSSVANTAKKIGGVIAAAFAVKKVVQFGKSCLELGSDLQEVQNVVDSVFTTMSWKVDEFAKSAAQTAGLSETMAKRYVGTFGAMAKSFGFTEDSALNMAEALTQLSGDVASFYNITQDEAYTKLKSVFTGETESLKELGVVMTQSALDQYALANGYGKTTSAMTEQEKVALRYKFVLSQLSTASGDFIRTSDSWANQVRIMKLQLESLMATIGQGLINIFTPVIKMINLLLAKLATVANAFKSFTELITGNKSSGSTSASQAGITSELGTSTEMYDTAADSANSLAESTENVTGAVDDNTEALKKQEKAAKRSIAAFDELNIISGQDDSLSAGNLQTSAGAAGVPSIGNVDYGSLAEAGKDANKLESTLDGIVKKAKELRDIFKKGFFDGLGDYKPMLQELKNDLSNIGKYLYEIFSDENVRNAINNFVQTFAGSVGEITGSIAQIGLTIATALVGGIESYLSGNVEKIKNFLISAFDVGSEIMQNLSGIVSTIADIFSVFSGQTMQDIIGELIQIFSDTFMTVILLAGEFIRDLLNIILVPLQENAGLIKQTIQGTLEFVESIVSTFAEAIRGILDGIVALYDEHIKPFLDSIASGVSDILNTLLSAYNKYILPVLNGLASRLKEIMEGPFGDMVKSVLSFIGKLIDLLKEVWDNILVPLLKWIIGNLAPQIADAIDMIGNIFLTLFESISEVIDGVFDALGGLIDFIAGVFTGDWKRAWEGIKEIFKGVFDALVGIAKVPINGVISLINGMLSGIVAGVNGAINAINRIQVKIPDWVHGIGGKTLGFNIPEVRAPQIPYLAQGTVIPPRAREFAAILGDNNQETEVVSPLSTMKQALFEALSEYNGGNTSNNVIAALREALSGMAVYADDNIIGYLKEKDNEWRNQNGRGMFEGGW